MKLIRTLIFVFSFFIALIAEGVVMANDPENSIQIELKDGNITEYYPPLTMPTIYSV